MRGGKAVIKAGWAVVAVLAVACSDGDPAVPEAVVREVRLAPEQLTIEVGDTAEVSASVVAEDGGSIGNAALAWSVADADVASVVAAGAKAQVRGLRAGQVIVSAAAGAVSGSALVQVNNPVPQVSAISPQVVAAGSDGGTLTVHGSAFMPGAVVLWNGVARAAIRLRETELAVQVEAAELAEEGIVEIRVQNPLPGGGVSPERQQLRIAPRAVATVVLSATAVQLAPGGTRALTVRALDGQGTELEGRNVAWSSSHPGVATVSSAGLVSGQAEGVAVITATVEGVSASATVTVQAAATGVPRLEAFVPDSAAVGNGVTFTVRGEGFVQHTGVFLGSRGQPTEYVSATELKVTLWSDESQAARTIELRAYNAGVGGGWSNTLPFRLVHRFTRVEIVGDPWGFFPGETTQLTARRVDEEGSPMPGAYPIEWSSADPAIASVDANGRVTMHAPGQTNVYAVIDGKRGVRTIQVVALPQFDLLYESAVQGRPELWLARLDGTGARTRLLPGVRAADPAATRDGARIAFVGTDAAGNQDIFVVNRDGTGMRRLTTHAAVDDQPAWSPDGARIVFRSRREGFSDIWIMNADGSNAQNLTGGIRFGDPVHERPTFTPDGERVVFSRGDASSGQFTARLASVRTDGGDLALVTDAPGATDQDPAYSADGRYLTFRRTLGSMRDQLLILDPRTGGYYVIINQPGAGAVPDWSVDGEWLAFTAPDPNGVNGTLVMQPYGMAARLLLPGASNAVWLKR